MAKKKNDVSDDAVFDLLIKSLSNDFGQGAIFDLSNAIVPKVPKLSYGSLAIDIASGGGAPKGRIVEIFGPESCLAEDSFIHYEVRGLDERTRINNKGGSIRRLYERFHKNEPEPKVKTGVHLQNNDSTFFVKSVDDENCIITNKILDVVRTGSQECFLLKTKNGFSIQATAEHKFLTKVGYIKLSDLEIGSEVFIHKNYRNLGRKEYLHRPDVCVKYHPKLPIKIVDGKYSYYRGRISRLAYEAHMNEMEYSDYIHFLNTASKEDIDSLWFIPDGIHIHHKDEDFLNNDFDNLCLISPSDHGRLHAEERKKNLSFIALPDEILSIEPVGIKETYDIKCAYPYNNYIAENFVVHNSGKTTICLNLVREAQLDPDYLSEGRRPLFIDVENALDLEYACDGIGVNKDKLLIAQPDSGDDALQIAKVAIGTGKISVCVVDSVAALVTKAELEGGIADSHIGLQARLMSQALRTLTPLVHKTGTILVFVNQIRYKIGTSFGNPEVTSGGNALKFYASQRLDVRRSTSNANMTKDKVTGDAIRCPTTVKFIKNKVFPPFRTAHIDMEFGTGINAYAEVLDLAVENDLIKKSGAWYSMGEDRIGQGRDASILFLKSPDNSELYEELKSKLYQIYFQKLEVDENGIVQED